MAITDLTNTTWYVPSGWEAEAGYGVFAVAGVAGSGSSNDFGFDELFIGYERIDINTRPTSKINSIAGRIAGANQYDGYSNSTSVKLTFTYGEDVTNPKLIAWLSEWGEMQEIYTLSGSWKFNETLNLPHVDATQYESCEFVSNGIAFNVFEYYYFELTYANNVTGDAISAMYYDGQGWLKPEYRTITFDGTQAVSKEFYEWFAANAKPIITDLTGYTVTVPAGWSATAGYGEFDITGVMVLPSHLTDNEYVGLGIGTNKSLGASENRVTFVSTFYEEVGSSTNYNISNTETLGFIITGGTDVTNSSLIQWLVDNNATFTKEGEEEPEEPETPEIPTTQHGEIYYKGNLVATLVEGETIVLHTKDRKFVGDIVIKNVLRNLIQFTIDGVTYYAVEGMTWAEWVESEYNTGGYKCSGNYVYINAPEKCVCLYNTKTPENPSSKIGGGLAYENVLIGGGNN